MTALEAFNFPETGTPVRTVVLDGEPWFVGRDICEVLQVSNPSSSIALLDDDERGLHTMDSPSGQQEYVVISESGMYSLILRSRRPAAKKFKRWVTHEVLPAIRKTGRYEVLSAAPTAVSDVDEHTRKLRELELRRAEAAVRFDEYRFEMELISAATSTDEQFRDNSQRFVLARFQGKAPEIEPKNRLLMVDVYLLGRGVSQADLRSVRSTFGKALKKAYVEAKGVEPGEVLGEVNKRERPVKAYYERDRYLFDQVFDARYAHLAPAMLPGVAA